MKDPVELQPKALRKGALVGLVVVAPVGLIDLLLGAVDGLDEGGVVFALFAMVLFGFFTAGFLAAKVAGTAPYTHGALAGLATFGAWLVLRVSTRALVGQALLGREGDSTFQVAQGLLTTALLAMSFGIFGALVAARQPQE